MMENFSEPKVCKCQSEMKDFCIIYGLGNTENYSIIRAKNADEAATNLMNMARALSGVLSGVFSDVSMNDFYIKRIFCEV